MSPNVLEPRRLRESPAPPRSIEGRLARQLRVLSVNAANPPLGRVSAIPRPRRYLLATVRIAVLAFLVVTASGVAAATATFVARRVWSPQAEVKADPSPTRAQPVRRARRVQVLAEPAGTRASAPELAAPPAPEPSKPAQSPVHRSLAVAERRSDSLPSQPRRQPEAPAIEPPALPSSPAPSAIAPAETPAPTAHAPSDVPKDGVSATAPTETPAPAAHAPSDLPMDGVSHEAALLRQALSALRRDHDVKRAQALLDDYDRRFGQGALALEAISVRAQALLQMGDTAGALELLERLPLSREGHTGELRVIRGELRSLSGRCTDALQDFDAVLRSSARASSGELARALFGRASCRARTGDLAGAEEDRQRYLKEFPQGPAARQLVSPP